MIRYCFVLPLLLFGIATGPASAGPKVVIIDLSAPVSVQPVPVVPVQPSVVLPLPTSPILAPALRVRYRFHGFVYYPSFPGWAWNPRLRVWVRVVQNSAGGQKCTTSHRLAGVEKPNQNIPRIIPKGIRNAHTPGCRCGPACTCGDTDHCGCKEYGALQNGRDHVLPNG